MVAPHRGPAIPSARRSEEPAEDGSSTSATDAGPATASRRHRRRLSWDIAWLGGRSTAPWVVLATVVILLIATVGALYARQRPDRLGWTTKTVVARSDSAVDFTFSVYKSPRAVAACDIVAADHEGGVGTLRNVLIPARTDGAENTQLTVTVPTTRRAETALLEGCRIVSSG